MIQTEPNTDHAPLPAHESAPAHRWSLRSLALIFSAWLILQFGGLWSPGLLDDVDSVYIQIAREMLARHDFVTPTIDGIRFFDKPPLMYWMAAASMRLFGIHDWAARLPLALGTLALFLAVYALGIRLFTQTSPRNHPDRAGLYASLALATSIGPYLYTRFYIPDILLALWMTLAVHLTLTALDRIRSGQSALVPCLAFAAVLAANVLTKGLIGLAFPLGFVLLYLALTRQLHLIPKLHLLASSALFLTLAAPWHILAALRNPAIPMPPGLELPAKAGWAWFYLYNEHVARFLSRRIPHDYGQTPIWLFWLFTALWLIPWLAFLPASIAALRHARKIPGPESLQVRFASTALLTWALLILGFFTLSARQEYYGLPALPALALLIGGALAIADSSALDPRNALIRRSTLRWSACLLVPLGTVVALVAGYFALTAPTPPPGADIATLLAQASANPADYNLSLSHLSDLSGAAMGLFRAPLVLTALSMLVIGPVVYLIRRSGRTLAANLTLAAAATVLLLAVHEGLTRFYPTLGSKSLALTVREVLHPEDLLLVDGELTTGSTLLFYTGHPVHLVNGRFNGPWFGSFWPDAPPIFETDASLHTLWASPRRLFLLTYSPTRAQDLARFAPVHILAVSGGKLILTNR